MTSKSVTTSSGSAIQKYPRSRPSRACDSSASGVPGPDLPHLTVHAFAQQVGGERRPAASAGALEGEHAVPLEAFGPLPGAVRHYSGT